MKLTSSLAVVAAATLALAAGPALATGASHTVSVGGTPVPAGSSVAFTAATPTGGTPNVLFSFKNNVGALVNLSCQSSTLSGTIRPGVDVVTITSSTWTSCYVGGLGPATLTQGGSWQLHSPTAYTAAANETVVGHVDDFDLDWKLSANPVLCRFKVKGAGTGPGLASVTFNESTQQLVVSETGHTGNLRLQNVSGCGGQLQNGNLADLQATYTVTATGGAINVTS